MINAALRKFVSDKNFAARVFNYGGGKPKQYDINNLTRKDLGELKLMLECDMSPENLTCDGELRGKLLADRVAYFNNVQDALYALEIA